MNRTEVERIAKAINGLRPDWPWNALVTFIEAHLTERAYRDVAVALTVVACDPETRTPKRVLEPGPWWHVGPPSMQAAESGIVTYCPHGLPGVRCADCHPRRPGVGPTPAQRAAMRQAVADARDAINRLERTNP